MVAAFAACAGVSVYAIAAVWVADAVVLHTAAEVFFACKPRQIGTATTATRTTRASSRMRPGLGREWRCGGLLRGLFRGAGRRAVLVVLIAISVPDKAVPQPSRRKVKTQSEPALLQTRPVAARLHTLGYRRRSACRHERASVGKSAPSGRSRTSN